MKTILLFISIVLGEFLLSCSPDTLSQEEDEIRAVLLQQEMAWNTNNIDQFMEGYWKSDSLQFIGSQITYGWEPTLSAYKKRYPNADAMGKLSFDIMQIMSISADAYLITGKYRLDRDKDHPEGVFTLLFRKKDEKWVIVYDHTS